MNFQVAYLYFYSSSVLRNFTIASIKSTMRAIVEKISNNNILKNSNSFCECIVTTLFLFTKIFCFIWKKYLLSFSQLLFKGHLTLENDQRE